jgi:hypothetical protein
MLSKLNLTQEEMQLDRGQVRSRSLLSHRWRPLCVLFVHLDANVMEACTQELKKAQFTVKSDFVLNLAQSERQRRAGAFRKCRGCGIHRMRPRKFYQLLSDLEQTL